MLSAYAAKQFVFKDLAESPADSHESTLLATCADRIVNTLSQSTIVTIC